MRRRAGLDIVKLRQSALRVAYIYETISSMEGSAVLCTFNRHFRQKNDHKFDYKFMKAEIIRNLDSYLRKQFCVAIETDET